MVFDSVPTVVGFCSNTFQVLCLDLNGCLALQHHITMCNCIYNVSMSTSRNIMGMNMLDNVCRAESIQNILLMNEILHQLIWRIPVNQLLQDFFFSEMIFLLDSFK